MHDKVLRKAAFNAFLERLIGTARTIAPTKKPDGFYHLEEVTHVSQVALDCNFTYYSAKKYVLPSSEILLRFGPQASAAGVEPVEEGSDIILFGLHPCDINALWTLEGAYTSDPKDENYLRRRQHVTIIGMDCFKPCDEYSFCFDMKTHKVQGSYDLFFTDLGDYYFVHVGSERGERLLGPDAQEAKSEHKDALQKAEKSKETNFKPRIEFDTSELPKRLEQSYDDQLWAANAKRCYSCGSCNLVCPTCYCFTVEDKLSMNLLDGERSRYWDGCMLVGFAQVAGAENFRPERSQRLRHRLFRKGKLIKELLGRPGCVGCGRCERSCTSKISIVATFNQLKGGA